MDGNHFEIQGSELGSYVSLYFHLPFCSKKCPYCHFYVIKTQSKSQTEYFAALKKEWMIKLPLLNGKTIISIYFGGGTPSQVHPSLMEDFFHLIFDSPVLIDPKCEITFEANPEDLSSEYLSSLKTLPINRLSIGVQSLDDETLKTLDRTHDAKKAIESIIAANRAGFTNISIDLMYDLPYQTKKSWNTTLNSIKNLPITHLSLYNLTIEPQTVFFKKQKELKPHIPNESLSLYLLNKAIETCEAMGLYRYEISAFAKKGFYSKHNTGYWIGREFHGYGCAAFSYFTKKRFKNVSNINQYINQINSNQTTIDFEEELDPLASSRELLAISLRLKEGVSKQKISPDLFYELEKLEKERFVLIGEQRVSLTEKGMLFYDTVASSII